MYGNLQCSRKLSEKIASRKPISTQQSEMAISVSPTALVILIIAVIRASDAAAGLLTATAPAPATTLDSLKVCPSIAPQGSMPAAVANMTCEIALSQQACYPLA